MFDVLALALVVDIFLARPSNDVEYPNMELELGAPIGFVEDESRACHLCYYDQ